MKEKDVTTEREDRAVSERQLRNPPVNTREEQGQRSDRQEEKKTSSHNINHTIHERARKSYHNDGPGGNYSGY